MAFDALPTVLDAIVNNPELYPAENFFLRADAMDFLDCEIVAAMESTLPEDALEGLPALKARAEELKRKLEGIDRALFAGIRKEIRAAAHPEKIFPGLLRRYTGKSGGDKNEGAGYDNLDAFMNGLLHPDPLPSETREREAEMVYYQKTPARIILEMVKRARLTPQGVFYDLGSGLGQVPILVRLFSGAKAIGVEFEPAYCGYAKKCVSDLNLSRVEILQADARAVEYPADAVYYLFTPFAGKILAQVLAKIRSAAQKRIKIFTFGPCTVEVSQQNWLRRIPSNGLLGEFESV